MVDEVSKPANTKLGNFPCPVRGGVVLYDDSIHTNKLSLSQVYMVFFGCYNGFSTAAITIEYYV